MELTMPRLSDSMEQGTIACWLRSSGEHVERGEEIVEIETDKATMGYEAECSGILEILAPVGTLLDVGAPIAKILPIEEGVSPHRPVNASPVARRLAKRLGVDLGSVSGTGRRGRILKVDIARYAAVADPDAARGDHSQPATASSEPTATQKHDPGAAREDRTSAAAPTPTDRFVGSSAQPDGGDERVAVELTRMQRTIADRMAAAKSTIPEFTASVEANVDELVGVRERLGTLALHKRPTLTAFVVRACAIALREQPKVNGSFRDGKLYLHGPVNVGVAVAVDEGLLVPTVRDADRKSLREIDTEIRDLSRRVREEALAPGDLSHGTFTVSSLGMYGVSQFQAIVNPPQAAILAVGAVRATSVVQGGRLRPGHLMTLTLTCDHRILMGADAGAFLSRLTALLGAPLELLA